MTNAGHYEAATSQPDAHTPEDLVTRHAHRPVTFLELGGSIFAHKCHPQLVFGLDRREGSSLVALYHWSIRDSSIPE
jgi:hypothetical protein